MVMKILNKPIDMISYHTATGEVKPIKFKLQEANEVQTVKIDYIIDQVRERYLGKPLIRYICVSVIDGISKRYELLFYPETIQWVLYKL